MPTEPEAKSGVIAQEGFAIALGCVSGLAAGVGLGTCIILLLGGSMSGMSAIVMLHSILAMIVMGAWSAPALVKREVHD